MSRHRHLRRSDLFLLRLWSEAGGEDGLGEPMWRGKVQRVVDGEARPFSDLEDLLATLVAMLSERKHEGQEGIITSQENAIHTQEGTGNG